MQFSERLTREFKRIGLPVSSPTHIAGEFNKRYPDKKVVQQTIRKWLGGDAIPTQDKLLALADWFDVSPQWLRFGTGGKRVGQDRKAEGRDALDAPGERPELALIFEMLTQLSPSNLKLADNLIRSLLNHQQE